MPAGRRQPLDRGALAFGVQGLSVIKSCCRPGHGAGGVIAVVFAWFTCSRVPILLLAARAWA
jgi:hypothetical protein